MVTMSCSGNLVWDVNKRLIGYNEPNTIRTNYLGKNKTSLLNANVNVGEISRKHEMVFILTLWQVAPLQAVSVVLDQNN